MKKQRLTKETLLQYIFEFGIENTCNYWSITEDQLDKILNPVICSNPKIRTIKTNSISIKADVSKIIANNYNKLWNKYVNDKSKLNMCQTIEDIFHTTLLKVMEDLSEIEENNVLEYIDFKMKMIKFETVQHQKELYKHQIYFEDANPKQSKENNN